MDEDFHAPLNKVWVCMHCGKTSKDRLGVKDNWSPTCTLNAKLFFRSMLKFNDKGNVEEIIEPPEQAKEEVGDPKRKRAK